MNQSYRSPETPDFHPKSENNHSLQLQLAIPAFNISRAAAHAAGMNTARMPTIRRRLVMVPARLARHSRRRFLHYPTHWPWQQEFASLWAHATDTGPPQAA